MEFAYQQLSSEGISLVENKQFAVECRVNDLTYDDVKRILYLDGVGVVDGYDVIGKEVKFTGKINYRLSYVDQEDVVKTLSYSCDFAESISSDKINQTDKIIVDCEVVSVGSSGMDIVRLTSNVRVKAYKIYENALSVLAPTKENCYCKTEKATVDNYVTTLVNSFTIEEEENIGKFDEILALDSNIILLNTKCEDNKITLSGECYVNSTYRVGTDVFTKRFTLPFTEEVEGACDESCSCYAKLYLENTKVVAKDNDEDLKLRINAAFRAVIFKPNEYEVVNDMYSMSNKLELKKEKINVCSFGGYGCFSERISGESAIDDLSSKEIIGVICPKNVISSVNYDGQSSVIMGVITACLLYKQENNVCSINIESAYEKEVDEALTDLTMITGKVCEITARKKSDSEIIIDATVKYCYEKRNIQELEAVVEAEENGAIDAKNNAISIIVIDKPKTFFEVAKTLLTTPEELERQNPNLVEPLKLGDKLYYYRKLSRNYG